MARNSTKKLCEVNENHIPNARTLHGLSWPRHPDKYTQLKTSKHDCESAKLETEKSSETRKPQTTTNKENTTRLATRFQIRLCVGVRSRNASTSSKKRQTQTMPLALQTIAACCWCASARVRDKETLLCLACGSPNMDAFDRYVVCTVFSQVANAASGCNWKDFSINGLTSSIVLHTHLPTAGSALVVVAVLRKHGVITHGASMSLDVHVHHLRLTHSRLLNRMVHNLTRARPRTG